MRKFRGITVRELNIGDIDIIHDLIKNDPDRSLYIGGDFNFTKEEFIKFLFHTEYGTTCLPAIIEKDGPIGVSIINNISSFKSSAHFRTLALSKKKRGVGYGFWAGAILGSYLFIEFGLNKVYAGTWSHNHNMEGIYKKAGFKLEGIDREHARINGEFVDRKLYGLLNKEVPKKLAEIFTRIADENKNTKDIRPNP